MFFPLLAALTVDPPICDHCLRGVPAEHGSFLRTATRQRNGGVRYRATPYEFNEADLVFFNERGVLEDVVFAATFAGGFDEPTHCGIVVKTREGQLGLLQAVGPHPLDPAPPGDDLRPGAVCLTKDILAYAKHYSGLVWVRPHRGQLSERQSTALTSWASRQVRKRYALEKLALPPIGLPKQTFHLLGPARTEASGWHCSGLVSAATIVLGVYDRWELRPAFTDPEDLFSDRVLDLRAHWERPRRLVTHTHRVQPRSDDPAPVKTER